MKKTFKLTSPTKKPERLADSVKCDVKRYIKRERRKEFPKGYDCWEFYCKAGRSEEQAESVDIKEISAKIDMFVADGSESVYIEILSHPGHRPKKVEE